MGYHLQKTLLAVSGLFLVMLGTIQINQYVFLIRLYWGKEKPSNSNLFLNDLVDELKYLADHGMDTDFGKRIVKVEIFCCDTPAKNFILCTEGHKLVIAIRLSLHVY
jgi:hypothetical protein